MWLLELLEFLVLVLLIILKCFKSFIFSTEMKQFDRCPFQKGYTCPTTYDVYLGRNDGPCMSRVGRSLHFWHSGDFGLRAARLLTSLSKAHGTNHSPDSVTYAT